MKNELVSIVVPCYNAEGYISNIIGDIQNQTYPYWELIVVSNGLNQNVQIGEIQGFVKKDVRIKLIHDDIGGVSRARNTGIAAAKGKWITFVDADDRIDSHHLQNYMDVIDDNSELVVVGVQVYDDQTGRCIENMSIKDMDSYSAIGGYKGVVENLMHSSWAWHGVWNKLFLRDKISKNEISFDVALPFSEDAIFNMEYIACSTRIQLVDKASYQYMRNSGGACFRYHKNLDECLEKRREVYLSLYKKLGWENERIKKADVQLSYHRLYNTITNLYKRGCLLSSSDKVANIRTFLKKMPNYREVTKEWRLCDKGGIQEMVFDAIVATGSPVIIHYVMTFLFWIKNLRK